VSSGVDATSHSTNDSQPGLGQIGSETFRSRDPVRCGAAGPHNGDPIGAKEVDGTYNKQNNRWIEDVVQALRIARIVQRNDLSAKLAQFLLLIYRFFKRTTAGDAAG
jgi:hypothetical protein